MNTTPSRRSTRTTSPWRKARQIKPLSLVTHIEKDPNGAWRVHYLDVNEGRRRKRQIVGKIVILAAGSIGSTEILLRSRDEFRTLKQLPRALGRGWSPNGDFLTLARYRNPGQPLLQPTKGPDDRFGDRSSRRCRSARRQHDRVRRADLRRGRWSAERRGASTEVLEGRRWAEATAVPKRPATSPISAT